MNRETATSIARELQLLQAPNTDVMFHGLSMEPLLAEGDRVQVDPVEIKDIVIGDIITYRLEDKFPTRRVTEIKLDYLILCCDNWPTVYFHAPFTEVLGRVRARTRDGETLTSDDPEWEKRKRLALRNYRLETSEILPARIKEWVLKRLRNSK